MRTGIGVSLGIIDKLRFGKLPVGVHLARWGVQGHLLVLGFGQNLSRGKLGIHTPGLPRFTLLQLVQKELLPLGGLRRHLHIFNKQLLAVSRKKDFIAQFTAFAMFAPLKSGFRIARRLRSATGFISCARRYPPRHCPPHTSILPAQPASYLRTDQGRSAGYETPGVSPQSRPASRYTPHPDTD